MISLCFSVSTPPHFVFVRQALRSNQNQIKINKNMQNSKLEFCYLNETKIVRLYMINT